MTKQRSKVIMKGSVLRDNFLRNKTEDIIYSSV